MAVKSRLTTKTTIEPKMQTLKPTSVTPSKLSQSEFKTKQAAYDKYVSQKAAYDADKSEYDARWNKWNEASGGQISPYNFEDAPRDPGKPSASDVKQSRGKMTPKSPVEKSNFTDPGRANKETVKTSRALTGGGNGLVKAKNPKVATAGATRSTTAQLGAGRVINTENKGKLGYNREQKLHKAYAGTSVLGESHIGKTSTDIKSYKNDMKSQRKEYRKEGNTEGVAATTMEIRQSRKAENFAARGEKGKNVHFTDKNYQKTTGNPGRISNDYKKSADNAANRNTMQAKLDAISKKPTNRTNMY
jgi:hypothetical protein